MPAQTRTAIVTGSSQGIGAAIAERLATDGLSVIVNYSRKSSPAEELVSKIEGAGGRARAIRADVSDPAAMAQLFTETERAFGGVDVLVNNAGIMKLATVAETSDELFDQTVAINLRGVFNGMREAAKRLREGGQIVSFSSSVVGLYQPTYAAYAATKAGVEAMTHVLAKELGPKRIKVNAIAPGPVATQLFLEGKGENEIKPIVERTPLGRLGEPEDIARAVAFLVSVDGTWINGQVLHVNGGII